MEHYQQPSHLEYPHLTMFQMLERMAKQHPKEIAYEFYGSQTTYQAFLSKIEQAAKAFLAYGIKRNDVVSICMPNTPQALVCFYALNRIGAISNMIHPLSAQSEITYYLNFSESKMILITDLFYEKVDDALKNVDHPVTILTARMQDELNPILGAAFIVKKGRPFLKYPNSEHGILWKEFIREGEDKVLPPVLFDKDKTSVILYSGGTNGFPKGICLTDLNFNALALQAIASIGVEFKSGLKMLSCMPCFHGFGLGINLHTILIHGATCILMPSFTNESYASILKKKKPDFIAGVPTIFEALLHLDSLKNVKLDFLKGMFCGGDSLSVELKSKIDAFLKDHDASIQVREGYGLTECVTACCLTPKDDYRPGSIGIPFPDTTFCIVKPGTEDEVPRGQEGEIILTGPTVMLRYLKNPEDTASTLRQLPDGRTWLFTGDLGKMDEDGFVYFSQRIKRMIITNGYNVYPGQLENVIDACPEVAYSCVIGIPDERRGQRIKAYVVLKDKSVTEEECREHIMAAMEMHVSRYAWPKDIEFRPELPKTLVGKVAFRKLEEENICQQNNQKENAETEETVAG